MLRLFGTFEANVHHHYDVGRVTMNDDRSGTLLLGLQAHLNLSLVSLVVIGEGFLFF